MPSTATVHAAGLPSAEAAEAPTRVVPATRVHTYSSDELLEARAPEEWTGGLRPLDTFGPYQLLGRLGVGGMAEVLLARHRLGEGVDKLVALKLVFPELTQRPGLSDLFLTEMRVSATLQHPNVIQVFDVGSAAGRPFMAMEYVHGRNGAELLARLRESPEPPPVALAVAITIELCRALEYLHEKRDLDGRPLHLVHRDVSPGNVLISLHGAVKLVDMGVAAASISGDSLTLLVGKRPYMSPEQAQGQRPEPAWDIYGAGLVLHELLTLERAFEGIGEEEARSPARRVPPPSAWNPAAGPELDRLVAWACDPDPSRRAPSARMLRQALEQVRASLPPVDLAQAMRLLFGEALAQAQHETELLIAAARGREGSGRSRLRRRVDTFVQGLVPTGVRLALVRHRRPLARGLLALSLVLGAGGAYTARQLGQARALEEHLRRADAHLVAAQLVGPGEASALAQLQRARALGPADARVQQRLGALADTFEHLGGAAARRGDVAEAVGHLRAALEADPGRAPLRARIASLEQSARR